MKISAVKEAIAEAERFLEKAKKVRPYVEENYPQASSYAVDGADTAACKRSSLDLSKALSKMRQS